MASASPSSMDMLVSVKVILDGTTRRFKRPLGDLGVKSLETQVRQALEIPNDTECTIERYSDSGAAYVVLDSANISVYKQLYRAAKAKQKLKLRVTTHKKVEEEEKKGPLPATVEDEPEVAAPPAPAAQYINTGNGDKPAVGFPFISVVPPQKPTVKSEPVEASLATFMREHRQMERNLERIEASFAALQSRPVPTPLPPRSLESLAEAARKSTETAKPAQPMCEKPAAYTSHTEPCPNFAVCCNSCDKTIPDAHYHCSTCDDGDFDLCQDCVDQGITCYGSDHWLLKRFVRNGAFVNSTTETIAPKPKAATSGVQRPAVYPAPAPAQAPAPAPAPVVAKALTMPPSPPPVTSATRLVPVLESYMYHKIRTCNSCVQELPDHEFLHCTTCADFDLCKVCIARNEHGHHPKHGFVPVVESSAMSAEVRRRLAPGRNQSHNAVCDGCDKDIQGVRHKCLDCPDWDYCSSCVVNARYIHPSHRFVQVYEPLESPPSIRMRVSGRPTHVGICCDGPLCYAGRNGAGSTYIVGTRYKCAVCFDTDFCANCEASPSNTHNKTHPLIKFKTPVKQVTVTTTGQNKDGLPMPTMGDHVRSASTSSRSTETTAPQQQEIVQTDVLTVADVQPSEPASPVEVSQEKVEETDTEVETALPAPPRPAKEPLNPEQDLVAVYEGDTVADGTILPPNYVFNQTWLIRNEGSEPWPAGCSAKFVGGDYMGYVDPNHPAGTQELATAFESTVCEQDVAPGELFRFCVPLRTASRPGRLISYWRLTTKDGHKFGPRLWCDVVVPPINAAPSSGDDVKPKEEPKEESKVEQSEPTLVDAQRSQMIFPKLEKESPEGSIHQEQKPEEVPAYEEEYEECGEDDEWSEDHSDEGFLTDEEYDILDASDEEFLEDQANKLSKK